MRPFLQPPEIYLQIPARHSDTGDMPGSTQYYLEKKIARGGMAEIWLARQIGGDGFQRICAVKRILPHYAEDAEYVQMFRDEAEMCKALRHTNIVRVEGFQAFGATWGMVMEFVEGTDLRALLHQCSLQKMRLTVPMAVYIASEAAKGLHYAHSKLDEMTGRKMNIVHRDISPQNLLLSFSGEVKVTDFGIADGGNRVTDTRPGIVKGKYSYMSPEQVSAKNVDGRSDVFSLGIVLWETLTMHRLFNMDTDVETIRHVHECRIPPVLRTLNPDVDSGLEAIVMRALQRDPHRRFETGNEFERELRRYLGQRYPEFTSEDLSRFLSTALVQRKTEIANDIRSLLSQPVPQPTQNRPRSTAPVTNPGNSINPYSAAPMTNAPQSSRQTAMRSGPQWQTRGTVSQGRWLNPIWLYALVIFGGLAGMMMLGQLRVPLTAKDPAQLVGKGNTNSVQLSINGKPAFHGSYKKIPIAIRLPPGRHVLTARRDGYFSDQTQVEIRPGTVLEEVTFNLKPKGEFARVAISANWATSPTIQVNINEGFYVTRIPTNPNGEGAAQAVPDLQIGQEYRITASAAEDASHRDVSCRFTPSRLPADKRTQLHIDFVAQNCTIFIR